VTFDPFGDFATEGYLRNFEKERDLAIVKRAENASFTTGLDDAFAILARSKVLTYDDVLTTHGILFGAIYPWDGQDRSQTAPNITIKKGTVIFANAPEIRAAVEFALRTSSPAQRNTHPDPEPSGHQRDYPIAFEPLAGGRDLPTRGEPQEVVMTHWHDTMVDRPETDGAIYATGWTISGLAVLGTIIVVWAFGI
jgi:hypothetical protein